MFSVRTRRFRRSLGWSISRVVRLVGSPAAFCSWARLPCTSPGRVICAATGRRSRRSSSKTRRGADGLGVAAFATGGRPGTGGSGEHPACCLTDAADRPLLLVPAFSETAQETRQRGGPGWPGNAGPAGGRSNLSRRASWTWQVYAGADARAARGSRWARATTTGAKPGSVFRRRLLPVVGCVLLVGIGRGGAADVAHPAAGSPAHRHDAPRASAAAT